MPVGMDSRNPQRMAQGRKKLAPLDVKPGMLDRDLYSVRELSVILDLHQESLHNLIKTGRLKAIYIGGSAGYRVRHQDVEDFLTNDSTQPPITNPTGVNTPHD